MRHYEIVVMIHPDQSEQVPAMVDKYRAVIKAHKGKVYRVEDWGRRSLAFRIRRVHKAHYLLLNVQADTDAMSELRSALHYNDAVLRHLVVRVNEAPEGASVMMEKVRRERKRESERTRTHTQTAVYADGSGSAAGSTPEETEKLSEAGSPQDHGDKEVLGT